MRGGGTARHLSYGGLVDTVAHPIEVVQKHPGCLDCFHTSYNSRPSIWSGRDTTPHPHEVRVRDISPHSHAGEVGTAF